MSICLELEKFFIFYQSNKPLLLFLYSDLYTLFKNLLTKIIKTEIIKNVKNGAKMSIDLENKDNFCDTDKVDIGFTAQKALKDAKKC